ncbi:MAG: MotA/TolQ/ExbB proton channel family protein [Akkermansiaceae bacterium]|nr:MotA/TolQ/ExbB proton channel family protein [Akkermansiaceae bacterium]
MPIALTLASNATWEFLIKGGVFMAPLGIAAFVGLTAIIFKFLSLARSRVIPDSLVKAVVQMERYDAEARASLEREMSQGDSTLARLLGVAMRHQDRPQGDMKMAVEASAREEASRLHAGIAVIDMVITVAPLLGLLGTASGLVTIFDGWSDDSDWVKIGLGIAQALNTTILGLAIAVPCVVAHAYFTRRIEVFSAKLEALLAQFAASCQAKPEADK